MAWSDEMLPFLRVLVDDTGAQQVYSDTQLQQALLVAAFQVNVEMKFNEAFTIDILGVSITPDPTAEPSRDDSFVNLVELKAACIIDRGSAASAARRAIVTRDGVNHFDLRGPAENKIKLLDKGWCAAYADAKEEYQAGLVRTAGAAVLSPFRFYVNGGPSFFGTQAPTIVF
jgi:hypothetical protein